MAKPAKPSSLADELRETQARLLGPPKCAGCQPECRDFVREVLDTALEQGIRISLNAVHDMVVRRGLFQNVPSSLRKHIADHERTRWQALKAAGLVRTN